MRTPATALLVLALAAPILPTAAAQPVAKAAEHHAQTVRPDRDENLQWAASVVELDLLRRQGGLTAKMFGTAGGDPAMNGLYTYLAFFEPAPGDGWRIFRLGDFVSYRILGEARGRLAIEVRESLLDEATGNIGARTRRLIISWRAGNVPPDFVTVTPAR